MGFFDIRCQVSGISSFCRELEGMLMLEHDGRLSPLSVLVRGKSNRLGGIDMIRSTSIVDASFAALGRLLQEGRLTLDVPYEDLKDLARYRAKHCFRDQDPSSIHGFEWLFSVLSYATWNETTALFLDGKPVRACLAVTEMLDAAVETIEARPDVEKLDLASLPHLLDLAFDPGTTAHEIHADAISDMQARRNARRALTRLARLRFFLDERGGPRAPDQEQDTDETEHLAAVSAFDALSGLPAFRRALAAMYPKALQARVVTLERVEAAKMHGAAKAYSPTARYKAGELVAHPKFGEGVVAAESQGGRVEIDFPDGRRKLVCG